MNEQSQQKISDTWPGYKGNVSRAKEHGVVTLGDMPLDLHNMHSKFGFHKVALNKNQLKGRLDFLQEELDEAYEALEKNNADDFVDAHIDLMVVAIGTLDLAEVDTWHAWDQVHRANMTKEPGANDKRHAMEGMDLRKPEGWQAPSHLDNVGKLPQIMMNSASYDASKYRNANLEKKRRVAIQFLEGCKAIMLEKADDYNWPGSSVKTADYYPRGLDDLFHMLHVKFLRTKSIIAKLFNNAPVKNEDLKETLRDTVVFSALTVEWLEGEMDGQNRDLDLFGRPKV